MNTSSEPQRKSVLLVDDEPQIIRLMELSLRALPINVHAASDGASALTWMQDHVPDLVVLDVMMPRVSGTAVYEAMVQDERLKDVPVLVVSVVYSDETLIRTSRLSGLPTLRKPFSPVAFSDRVCGLLGLATKS